MKLLHPSNGLFKRQKTLTTPWDISRPFTKNVTITIKNKIGTGYFENDERMIDLDVTFANRYITAYANFQEVKPISESWKVAFEAAKEYQYIVLQHLLFGMNAHINLDLGIAAAQITQSDSIADLEIDFNKINDILGELTNEVQEDLAKIWPKLLWILKFFKKTDGFLVNFGMNIARKSAWKFANELVIVDGENREKQIAEKDGLSD